jgi:hypothetical protein
MNKHIVKGKYRAIRPSKSEREKLLAFHRAVFQPSENHKLPKANSKDVVLGASSLSIPDEPNTLVYTDINGNVVTLDVNTESVSLDELDWFVASQSIYPGLSQCCYKSADVVKDARGRENILGENFFVIDGFRTDVNSQHGFYFIVRAIGRERGEFSFASGGQIVNEALEQILGIELATGRKLRDDTRELDDNWGKAKRLVQASIMHAPGGQFGNGYFVLIPPVTTITGVK